MGLSLGKRIRSPRVTNLCKSFRLKRAGSRVRTDDLLIQSQELKCSNNAGCMPCVEALTRDQLCSANRACTLLARFFGSKLAFLPFNSLLLLEQSAAPFV
jgi:hypothetical protein